MKRSIFLVLCCVVVFFCEASKAKPQGPTHEAVADKCCNNCVPCRASFDVEKPVDPDCPRPKKYSYHVQAIDPHCPHQKLEILDADVEKPVDPPCPKKLKLSARVEHNPKDCDCPLCRYENLFNITLSNATDSEHYCTNKSYHGVLKQQKLYEFRSSGNLVHEELEFDYSFPKKRYKRTTLDKIDCAELIKQGYICRCVPDDGTSCFPSSHDGDPIVGSPFREDFDENEVYVGGGKPPSYDVIRKHITPILVANDGKNTIQEVKGLAEIYYEIYKRHNEKNLTIPIKYGTKTVEKDSEGLRTYDIEPVEGQYTPSAIDKFAHFSNHMFGEFVDRVKQLKQLPRLGLLPFRQNRQSRRIQRNSKRKESQKVS
nr:uncharacterized protein LOC109419361 isoform X1 [Aedes albopictus]